MTSLAPYADNLARTRLVQVAQSLFDRGLTFGSTGNVSVRLPDGGWLMTPTNASLGTLDPATLSRLDAGGNHIDGDAPTKEAALHLAMYRERTDATAVIHLHAAHSVAVSVLEGIDPADVLPALTAYYVMRIGRLPLVPYMAPGDPELAAAVGRLAGRHHAVLLANHGPVVAGTTLENAQFAIEELEQTARIYLLLGGMATRPLSPDQVEDLRRRFNLR